MAPYLNSVKSFADVNVDENGVNTEQFLEAAKGLVGLFDLLGSTAFSLVQSDIQGNIEKVRKRYNACPGKSDTLERLVENEKEETEKTGKKREATEGLMWLLRGLQFTCGALQRSQQQMQLDAAFRESYENSLKKFHGFVVRGVFKLAMTACPDRATFYAKLKADPEKERSPAMGGKESTTACSDEDKKLPTPSDEDKKFNDAFNAWLSALDAIVKRVQEFYTKYQHDKGF